jgi:hypothetical protein
MIAVRVVVAVELIEVDIAAVVVITIPVVVKLASGVVVLKA